MFDTALFIMLIIGIVLVLYALVMSSRSDTGSAVNVDNSIKAVDAAVAEADSAISELENTAKYIADELESKYQELLFLYTLIDEKKQKVDYNINNATSSSSDDFDNMKPRGNERAAAEKQATSSRRALKASPKYQRVTELYQSGRSAEQIARELSIGQGEVRLIIELSSHN